jgi:hypothetical protein
MSIDSTLMLEVPILPVTSKQLVEVIVRNPFVVRHSKKQQWKVYLWARKVISEIGRHSRWGEDSYIPRD